VLGRWGGEEFLVLTRYSSKKALLAKTERFGDAIRSVHVHPEHSYPLTASIGVRVVYPDDDLDLEDHVSAADHAMYEAKASGRNRVVLSLKEQAERDGKPA
jgi:diguanylate cyclase (GGDEF)-like protein